MDQKENHPARVRAALFRLIAGGKSPCFTISLKRSGQNWFFF